MFSGLTASLCEEAYELISQPIAGLAATGVIDKYAGHLLVLDPAIPYEPKYNPLIAKQDPTSHAIKDLVLWCRDINESHAKTQLYADIARSKALVSFMTGLPSRLAREQFPHLMLPGMTYWAGSIVSGGDRAKLVVAFSGVKEYYDEMISTWMASAITALCHRKLAALRAAERDFIDEFESEVGAGEEPRVFEDWPAPR